MDKKVVFVIIGTLFVGLGALGVVAAGVVAWLVTSQPTPSAPAAPIATSIAAPGALDPRERGVLRRELAATRADGRRHSADIAAIEARPSVRRSARTRHLTERLSRTEVERALIAQRVERFVAADDPRARAYERELARLVAEQRRTLQLLEAVALEERLHAEDRRAIDELEDRYARTLLAYHHFDESFRHAMAGSPPGWAVPVDFAREPIRPSTTELHFTFATYLAPETHAFYAEYMGIAPPAPDMLALYATWDVYGAPPVESDALALPLSNDELDMLALAYGVELPPEPEVLPWADWSDPYGGSDATFDVGDAEIEAILAADAANLEAVYPEDFAALDGDGAPAYGAEDPTYGAEDPTYAEPTYEAPTYEAPTYEAPAYEAPEEDPAVYEPSDDGYGGAEVYE